MKRYRRLAIAAVALTISAALLRPQISSALVIRGDEFAYRGQTSGALRMYERAIVVDRDNASAVDRLAFTGAVSHRAALVREAVSISSRYLAVHPADATILNDRGLAYQILRDYRSAERDFAKAGSASRDARNFTFAGFAAIHARDMLGARKFFHAALGIDRSYVPALRGLARLP
ncbi:MAG: hypothetical protein M3R51_00520 [Candidatus Eremiobacteraeota bacterium]|nr:hypothetical protein [Candidatus Eremiobacteraeota bacterium]